MKHFLLMIAVVMGQSVLAADKKPLIANPIVEKAIRNDLKKSTSELTKADLEKVTFLVLNKNRLTDISALAELTQLKRLQLSNNQLTDVNALAGLNQLKYLALNDNQLTDIRPLAELTKLKWLYLNRNPDLTKAQIDELKKALPKCKIVSNPKK